MINTDIKKNRSAFTLMELLIVISIIMILMGLVFVGVRLGREAARKAKTSSAMQQLEAALIAYRTVNGHFPDSDTAFPYLVGATSYALGDAKWKEINESLVEELKKSGGSSLPAVVVDGWNAPLRYRPSKFYPYSASASAVIDGENPPAQDSYQIWSKGGDGEDTGGGPANATGNDDIVSWPKK